MHNSIRILPIRYCLLNSRLHYYAYVYCMSRRYYELAIINYALYDSVGMCIYRKAVLTKQCRRWRTLNLTGYFCSALDMFTIMIGAWAIP